MSDPANTLDLNSLFSGGKAKLYPTAPEGMHYTMVPAGLPPPPVGQQYVDMRTIAKNSAPGVAGQRYQYKFGAHTPEGIAERTSEGLRQHIARQEQLRNSNPNYNPRGGFITDQPGFRGQVPRGAAAPQTNPWDRAPAVASTTPTVGAHGPSLASKIAEMQTMRTALESLTQTGGVPSIPIPRPSPRGLPLSKLTPAQEADWKWAQGIVPVDTTQSKLDAKVNPETDLGEVIQRLLEPGSRVSTTGDVPQGGQPASRFYVMPQVLRNMWENLTAPVGPAFDPHNVDLDAQRYNPLPNEEEQ